MSEAAEAADLFGGMLPRASSGWSVNRLATELGLDRRTVTKRLVDVAPLGDGPAGPVYTLADAVRAIFGQAPVKETDALKRRILAAQAEDAELDLERKRGGLVDANDVRHAAFENARIEREALLAWLARVAPSLAAEMGVDLAVAAAALDRELRAYMEGRADDAGIQALP